MAATSNFLFVYGTLRPNFDNDFSRYLRQRAHYVGEGSFPGQLFDLGSYPGAVYAEDNLTTVWGTVYDISKNNDTVLTYLDYYEGVGPQFDPPTEYLRVIIPVLCNDTTIDCWAYLYNHPTDNKSIVLSGDYGAHLNLAK